MITIVDYGVGNIKSFVNVYNRLNIPVKIAKTSSDLEDAHRLILPGVGHFDHAMSELIKSGMREKLDELVLVKKIPVIGICVGMQMFADVGYEETETKGLGWISGNVKKIDNRNNKFKLPHIGWNELSFTSNSKLLKEIGKKPHVYFVHSYKFIPSDEKHVSSKTNYSEEIVASVEKDNLFGTQFHPEKSDRIGLRIIENFIKL